MTPAVPETLDAHRATFFEFDVGPGALLLAYTDGVNECHYRNPQASPGPRDHQALYEELVESWGE